MARRRECCLWLHVLKSQSGMHTGLRCNLEFIIKAGMHREQEDKHGPDTSHSGAISNVLSIRNLTVHLSVYLGPGYRSHCGDHWFTSAHAMLCALQ
ncbi:hypothetical protein CapIbe_005788 [Capra ibex]